MADDLNKIVKENIEEIGRTAAGVARFINPGLSEGVDKKVGAQAMSAVTETLTALQSGKLKIGDKEATGGTLVLAFKDQADNKYGGLAIKFDKQGEILGIEKAKPGSREATALVEGLKNDPVDKAAFAQDYRVVGASMPVAQPLKP